MRIGDDFWFVILVFSYLAKFLANLDSQYESLFGNIDSTNETLDVKDLSQKISKYLKISQRTLSLPVGEVMLNRKGKSYVKSILIVFVFQ